MPLSGKPGNLLTRLLESFTSIKTLISTSFLAYLASARRWSNMAPTFASGLTLSATVLAFKALARATTKSLEVRGLPILQTALNNQGSSSDTKGKCKAIEVSDRLQDVLPALGRRGVVTGELELTMSTFADNSVCNHNSVIDDPMVREQDTHASLAD